MFVLTGGVSTSDKISACINTQEDEKEDGESPKRGTSVAEEGQGDADDRGQSEHHAYVDEYMEEEDAGHAIAIDTSKLEWLSFRNLHQTGNEGEEKQQDGSRTEESLLFTDRTEDEVGVLLGNKFQLCLCTVEETFALQSARSDGNLALMNVVACSRQVVIQSEQYVDTHALVGLHHVVEHVVGGVEEGDGS